jgi:glycosyltransferase involved in cell wall biosynthesis
MISVIIPAYNEEKLIGKTIKALGYFFKNKKIKHEIIVVDDYSSDNTYKEALKAGARVLRNKKNKGQSFSVIRGIKNSKFNKIITFDADYEIPIENTRKHIASKRKNFIIGKREFLPRKSERFLAFVTRHVLGIYDPLCYLKLFDKRDMQGIMEIKTGEKYSFQLVELAARNKLKIKNIVLKGVKRRHESKHRSNIKIWVRLILCALKSLKLGLRKI